MACTCMPWENVMYFDMMVFKRTNLGLEMSPIGVTQASVMSHPDIWMREDIVLISTRDELLANEMKLWCRSRPLPGWWTNMQLLEFITNALCAVPNVIEGWVAMVEDWDKRFSRDEQDEARIKAEEFNNLVY